MPLQGRSWSGFKAPYLEEEGRRGKPHRGGDLPSQDRKTSRGSSMEEQHGRCLGGKQCGVYLGTEQIKRRRRLKPLQVPSCQAFSLNETCVECKEV